MTELLDFISGSEDKFSGIELETKKEEYAKGVKKARRVTKAEQNQNGANMTPAMGGKITVSKIIKEHRSKLEAELVARKVELPKPMDKLNMQELQSLLKKDEMKVLAAIGKARDGIDLKSVKDITPISKELIALMNDWYSAKQLEQESTQTE